MFEVWELAGGLTLKYQLCILILLLANVCAQSAVTFSAAQPNKFQALQHHTDSLAREAFVSITAFTS